MSYYNSFKLPIKIIRPFNNFGPRQSERAIIPTIISQLLSKKNEEVNLGNVSPTRDFTYVEDTCNAYIEMFKNNNFFGEITNVGTNSEISINDLYLKINKIMNINKKIFNKIIEKDLKVVKLKD